MTRFQIDTTDTNRYEIGARSGGVSIRFLPPSYVIARRISYRYCRGKTTVIRSRTASPLFLGKQRKAGKEGPEIDTRIDPYRSVSILRGGSSRIGTSIDFVSIRVSIQTGDRR